MKKFISLILLYFICVSGFALETKGQLIIDTKRTNGAIVGETYAAVLTLVPFELDLISVADVENKTFLDYFYVSRVLDIKKSKNNADAIQVYLDLVLLKNFENQDFKIWSLESRNIPVSFKLENISKTDLVIKDFITYDTDLSPMSQLDFKILSIAVAILIIGLLLYFWLKKRGVTTLERVDIGRELRISKNHSDFEWLYRNRKVIIKFLEGKPQTILSFEELTGLIEEHQFQPKWRDMDISELISKKNKVLELYKNGV